MVVLCALVKTTLICVCASCGSARGSVSSLILSGSVLIKVMVAAWFNELAVMVSVRVVPSCNVSSVGMRVMLLG